MGFALEIQGESSYLSYLCRKQTYGPLPRAAECLVRLQTNPWTMWFHPQTSALNKKRFWTLKYCCGWQTRSKCFVSWCLLVPVSRRIPLWGGVLITIADTFVFLFLDKYGNFSSWILETKTEIQLFSICWWSFLFSQACENWKRSLGFWLPSWL